MFTSYRNIMARKAAGEMDETGFTLIELLIVIVVLGILAGVVIFALGGVTGQSAVAACKADGATVQTALAVFNTDNPNFAGTAFYLQADLLPVATTSTLPPPGPATVVGGPFLQTWPINGTVTTPAHYSFALSPDGVLSVTTVGPKGATLPYTPAACDTAT